MSAVQRVPGRGVLVHRHLDGWLLGGVGVVAWLIAGTGGAALGLPPAGGVVLGLLIGVSAMHFGASYHLAYATGRGALRSHPIALVAVPVLLLTFALMVITSAIAGAHDMAGGLLRLGLVAVFTLTGWHYIKQAFGVAMVAARQRGVSVSRPEAMVLRYALYPLWFFNVMEIYGRGRGATYLGFDVTFSMVPELLQAAFGVVALTGAAVAGGLIVVLGLRMRAVPPAGLWATYLAAVLWFAWPPDYVSAAIILGGVHGLQYLACAHRAELAWAVERGEANLSYWWLCVFGGAAAGGLLVVSWLPAVLDGRVMVEGIPSLFGALLFVSLNLHHYAIDAAIWRSGGPHVKRLTTGPLPDAVTSASSTSVEQMPDLVATERASSLV